MQNWVMPEIGAQKVVYEATREGVSSAELPKLLGNQSKEGQENTQTHKGRLRVTEVELQNLLEEARQQGFEEGRANGEQQGYQDAAAKGAEKAEDALVSALSSIESLEAQLPAVVNVHNQREQQLILKLLEKLVASVTQAELQIGRANLEGIVTQAINCLADADQVIAVRVAPADYESLSALKRENNWSYLADESLKPGDCIVEARRSMLDHSVEHRIDEALSALRSQFEAAD